MVIHKNPFRSFTTDRQFYIHLQIVSTNILYLIKHNAFLLHDVKCMFDNEKYIC